MNRLQLIVVLETDSENGTDALYFNSVLREYFEAKDLAGSEVNIRHVFMEGKTRYNDEGVLEKINNYSSMFNDWDSDPGVTKVIYCFDTDSTEKKYKDGSFFDNVMKFCQSKGYDLVWFCKNVENVFLGVEPETLKSKLDSAIEFVGNNAISNFDKSKLEKKEICLGCSNILIILSKYLMRKK